jgi:hippurate hydrolase
MIALRRTLHRFPELSHQEHETAARIGQALEELGVAFRAGVAGTGVVADIPGVRSGPIIALRADMDALPIVEETGLPFASERAGIMHACGHDGHTSMLVGAAALLCRESHLPLPVRLIFQPAEELGGGAKAMVEAGVLDGVAMIFGGHLDRHYPTGTIIVSEGAVNASTDTFHITITGQGSHAARPHESIDAVVVGSLLVMALQTIVSREVNPAFPSVVTIGRFDAGTAANVIAGQARLEGTIRAQHPQVREHLKKSLQRMVQSVGQLHGAAVQIEFRDGTPAVINDPAGTAVARQAAVATVGAHQVQPLRTANMGGEDFSYFLEQDPGCYVRFGAQVPGKEGYPAHSSKFDFDEKALAVGAAYYFHVAHAAALHVLEAGPS